MVEQQPALGRLDRRRAGADLRRLPRPRLRAQHVPVPAPVHEVGALRVEDVAERRVPVVARPAEHRVRPADPPREEHAVAVERQERVVGLVERLEVVRPPHPDRRPVVAVAPRDVVAVLEPGDARVVRVNEALGDLGHARVGRLPRDRLVLELPSRRRRRCGPRAGSSCACGRRRGRRRRTRPRKGTTAELKMLFARGIRSRGMTGLRLERQTTSLEPAGRSSHGIAAGAPPGRTAARLVMRRPTTRRSGRPRPARAARRRRRRPGRRGVSAHFVCSCGTEASSDLRVRVQRVAEDRSVAPISTTLPWRRITARSRM